ncbi:thiamine pyrophosphate enzyme [Durotheca rogersii]|uniref:thiamine pyrophosphate enzyme n=1 Tax=Durotheca rogersii TaxID=419775 RepID=UPI00221F0DD8|nr:thiamine pyrophosphate enzyme [Durotheca rogersii]KAI5864725.1 thiamine pyrophosphate enzyme [Durotheca rogersii]
MSGTTTLAEYLFVRLRQMGVGAVHGVPGDYNLTLLDYVEPAGLDWVGNANELNAGYAADGYARIKGVGAIITTFGVGELSAINAIAGAYAERAAVVHIVGTPSRVAQDARRLIHHTFNDGEYRRFAQMHAHVTVAQASLRDPQTIPDQIDHVLQQCLIHSRPVYIEVPVDLVSAPIPAARLGSKIGIPRAAPTAHQAAVIAQVVARIQDAKRPIIYVDGESRALGIVPDVQDIVTSTGWPTWTSPFGKGLLDETAPNVHGIYKGSYDDASVQDFINGSDLILCFGPHFGSSNTYNYSSIPKAEVAVIFTDAEIRIGGQIFRDIPVRYSVSQVLKEVDFAKVKPYQTYPDLPRDYSHSFSDVSRDDNITQDKFWRIVSTILQPGDIVLGETGTAGFGCREFQLPPHASLFTPVTWLSIGYMLGAAQGAALAQRELIASSDYYGIQSARTVLFIGDGSFQMTVQELGTIIRKKLDVVLFLINNDGYTIERCIHGLEQAYNDVTAWRYLQAPGFFGAGEDTYTASVRTWGDLQEVLEGDGLKGGGFKMVEVFLSREDAPQGILLDYLKAERARTQNKPT